MPGRQSFGRIGSIVAFFCGVVSFSRSLTEWTNSFRFSFSSVAVFVVVVVIIIVCIVVCDGVFGVTVFVSRNILSFFSLLFLPF